MTVHCNEARHEVRREEDQVPRELCSEHSGQKILLYALLGLVGTAVGILLVVISGQSKLEANLIDKITGSNSALLSGQTALSLEMQGEMGKVRERVAVIEYRIGVIKSEIGSQ